MLRSVLAEISWDWDSTDEDTHVLSLKLPNNSDGVAMDAMRMASFWNILVLGNDPPV